jgi:carbon-monoxide dehydrogenase large subunit
MSDQLEAQLSDRYVGARIKPLKGDGYVTGRARYVADVSLPGMLHMAVLRSSHAHARIRNIETTAAKQAPGVVRVLAGAESRNYLDPIPKVIDPAIYGGNHVDNHCLALDKVIYVGHPIAVVVANSKQEAKAALKLIHIDYEPLPAVVDAEAALEPNAPRLIEQWDSNILFRSRFAGGDVDRAFSAADHVIEDTMKIHRYSTQPIETRAYVAVLNRFDGTLTLHATAQNPHPLRTQMAGALRMPEHRIRIIVPNLGGAFGLKMHGHPEEALICLMAKLTDRPVKWVEEREETLLIGGREQVHHFEVAFKSDGRVVGLKDNMIGNVGAPASTPGWGMVYLTALTLPCVYQIENMEINFTAVVTNKGPWNASRGYGKEAANLLMDHIMDMIAIHLRLDPVDVRLKNFIPPEAFPHKTVPGLNIDNGNYHEVLEKTLELIGYQELRQEQQRLRRQGRYIGIGICYEITPEGGALPGTLVAGYDTSTVKVDPAGFVTVLTGVTSPGGGNDTSIAQVVADELGVDVTDIRVIQGDTDACPYGFGNYSGRSTIVGGGSAALAARAVREKIAKMAGALLASPPQDLIFHRGRIYSKDSPDRSLSFQEVAYAGYSRAYDLAEFVDLPLESTKTYRPVHISHTPDEKGRINPYPSYSNGAYIAMVEVDPETGVVKVLKFAVIHDCGVMVNPQLVEGQTLGGVAMGIGAALGEELAYRENGQPLVTSFKEYLMPRAADLPSILLGHYSSPSPYTMLGTKGAGEAGVGGSKTAVVNAVADALSVFDITIRQLPLRPPTIWRLIQEATRRGISEAENGSSE